MQERGVNQHLALVACILFLHDEPRRLKHRKYLLAKLVIVQHPPVDGVVLGEYLLPREPELACGFFPAVASVCVLFCPRRKDYLVVEVEDVRRQVELLRNGYFVLEPKRRINVLFVCYNHRPVPLTPPHIEERKRLYERK